MSVSVITETARIIHSAFLPNLRRTYNPIMKPNTAPIMILSTFIRLPH